MKIGVFHPGTQHSWQTALALQQRDRLAWFATSIFYKPEEWPYRLERLLPGRLGARAAYEFRRFSMPSLNPELVRTAGVAEWLERIATRLGWRQLARELDRMGNRHFVNQIATAIRGPEEMALWGYDGCSVSSFELARQYGRRCILDRTIGDSRAYNAAMDGLQDRYGEWFLPIERRIPDSDIALDEREYALADHILVGCEYAAQTLRDHATTPDIASKIRVMGYCYDEVHFSALPPPLPVDRKGPVRFLFLGLVNPRKGIHHVLEAISRIPRSEAELTIIGDLRIPRHVFARYAERVTYHHTVARADVGRIMAQHDVLLLPTYHEGAGITLYEALAAGMGIIQSDRAALVASDRTGITLDRIDTETLLAAMRVPIEDRDRLDGWRAAAQGEARKYSFAHYRDNIARFLAEAGI